MTWEEVFWGVLIVAYVVSWVVYLVHRYRYILKCPVPLWSSPRMECFHCPYADRCGRVSWLYEEWALPEDFDFTPYERHDEDEDKDK